MSVDLRSSFLPGTAAASLDLPIPVPRLDFRMSVTLNPKVSLGPGPFGQRNWISFSGGQWQATWGSGVVVPGGQDSQLVHPETLHTWLETNYLLQTSDEPPAYIAVQTSGWRTGPREVLEKLFDPVLADAVNPSEYQMRLNVKLETGDERYAKVVNGGMWIGSGARRGAEESIDQYEKLYHDAMSPVLA
ncbi:hypothetical protein LTR95_010724 [Oleoguttula sp. CCFEE 5521]